MRRGKGFTLIELLVVVAIIALLIAILMPSLGKARERAKLSVCSSNLHALTTGAGVYAASWDNYMPPQRGETNDPTATMNNTAFTYQMNNGSKHYGFGLLYDSQYITDPRVYYCPSQTDPDFMLDPAVLRGTSGGFLSLNKSAAGGGRMGYHFQVYSKTNSDTAYNDVLYPKQMDFPPNAFVAIDSIWTSASIAHGAITNASTKWNASFSDGHVSTITSPQAVSLITISPNNADKWSKFAPIISAMQTSYGN